MKFEFVVTLNQGYSYKMFMAEIQITIFNKKSPILEFFGSKRISLSNSTIVFTGFST